MAIYFLVEELRREVDAFRNLASSLLENNGQQLHTLNALLPPIASSFSEGRWAIHESNPLRTVRNQKRHQPGDRGGAELYAEMSFIWELTPERKSGNTQPAKVVSLRGAASTRIRFFEVSDQPGIEDTEVADWRMEIASPDSPGAYFHVQVMGRETKGIFPKRLDVPRLPSVLVSPVACMEFALGELHQAHWRERTSNENKHARDWAAIQRRRHEKHLQWVGEQVRDTSGSPWMAWKHAKPKTGMFTAIP